MAISLPRGDLGYFDNEGRPWFCGRKSHHVITGAGAGAGEETYCTIPGEGVFNGHPKVRRWGRVGAKHLSVAEPVLVVEMQAGVRESKSLRQELLELGVWATERLR